MNRSYSKIRHIQESNIVLENRLLFKKILIESENKLLYDTELCETIKDKYGFNSENQLINWYDSHKDKDTLAWFFKNDDPRIKKHLDHINTKCVGNDVELKSSIAWWWHDLTTMYCSAMDETYGRYYRELNSDPKVVNGCRTSEMIKNDNINFPSRHGY